MKCRFCNVKEATVHISQMVDGSSSTVDFCEVCAKKMGVNDPSGFSLANLLTAIEALKQTDQNHRE